MRILNNFIQTRSERNRPPEDLRSVVIFPVEVRAVVLIVTCGCEISSYPLSEGESDRFA